MSRCTSIAALAAVTFSLFVADASGAQARSDSSGLGARRHPADSKALPITDATFRQVGRASWYGGPRQGHRTASGERFDQTKLTAAHRNLPFDSWVRVTNLENHRIVVVRINDRGPYAKGRVIDLSARAARDLGMKQRGSARVRIDSIPAPLEQVAEAR
jgi:rare lipoprotein A